MNTLAAAALAFLVPLNAGAVVPPKVDANKWDAATERNAPHDWVTTQIGDDTYIAFVPKAALWKSPAYAPKAKGAKFSTPLFKVGATAKGAEDPKKKGSEVWTVATEKSNYRLDFGAPGKLFDVVCVQAGNGCPPNASMPVPLDTDGAGFKGIPTNQANVVLRVSPPGAAATTATAGGDGDKTTRAAATDGPALGPWEKIAWDSIAKPTDEQARDIAKAEAPNNKTREALNAALATYLTAAQAKKPADALSPTEVAYVKARLGGDGAAFEAASKWPDASSADAQKFTTRWRGLIVKEVKDYSSRGQEQRIGYAGSTAELTAARKEDVNSAQAPGSPLEAKLAAFHPGQGSRREGAQRAVVAAWIENQQGDRKFKKIKEDLMAGKTPSMSWDAMLAAAMRWVPAQIKDAKSPTLANVPKETLLDAYCDPNKTNGGAANGSNVKAMDQLRKEGGDTKKASTAGTSEDAAQLSGGVTDGSGSGAVDPLQGDCSKRLAAVRSMVPDAPVNPVGNLTLRPEVPTPAGGTGGVTGDTFNKSADQQIGKNDSGDAGAKDEKFGDHVRSGAVVGSFLGMMAMIGGGPLGLLVMGAVGFGIGFGIDKLINSK